MGPSNCLTIIPLYWKHWLCRESWKLNTGQETGLKTHLISPKSCDNCRPFLKSRGISSLWAGMLFGWHRHSLPSLELALFASCQKWVFPGLPGTWQRCHEPSENLVLFVLWLSLMTGDGFNSEMWNQFTYASTQTGLGGTFLLQGCTTAGEPLLFTAFLHSIKHCGFGILPRVMTSGKLHRPAQPGFSPWNCHASYIHALADSIWGREKRLQCFVLWLYKLSALRFFD